MKLNAFYFGVRIQWMPKKFLLIMKLVIVIILCSLMQVSAATFGQQLTLSGKNMTLKSVFKEIKKQTGYEVIYADKTLNDQIKIDVDFKSAPLKEVLDKSLENLQVSYVIDDKGIVIKEKAPSFLDKLKSVFNSIDVHGRVVDEKGLPMPGVTVKVKNASQMTTADANGYFMLRKVDEKAVIVVSFIGYTSQEIGVRAELGAIAMQLSNSKLDELQIIAYGTTTQRLSTGNVTSIKAAVIEKQPVNNPLLALEGRVPGLFVEQVTGFAGTGVKVRVQGQNSLANGSNPLYVIDGVPYPSQLLPGDNPILDGASVIQGIGTGGSPLSFINPADIESIDVLKDADATAIYGSRAASGAILITTKKGKAGDTRVNLNLQSGWGKVPRELPLMNNVQYLAMRRNAMKNDGTITPAPGAYGDADLNGTWDASRNTDWQKELIGRTAGYQDLNASVSGGSNLTTFLVGTGYHRETSVMPGNFTDRKGSVHFNINSASSNQRFKLLFSGNYLFDNNKLPQVDFTGTAMQMAPVAPALYKPDGSINWAPDVDGNSSFYANPIGSTFDNFVNNTSNLISNLVLSYQIIPGLDLKSSFGYNKFISNTTSKTFLYSYYPELAQYLQRQTIWGKNSTQNWIVEPQLSYRRAINKGQLEVLLGATLQQNDGNGSQILAYGFSNDLVMDDILSATTVRPLSSNSFVYRYEALFGRINYNWEDKYILNLSSRRDGSSRFGPGSQFHNFASAGAAWIFSNERLFKESLAFISFGKLRGSYGTTGNDQIGDYQFMSLYSPQQQDVPYQGISIYKPNNLTNPYLQWEATRKLEIGLDLGFLKDRVLLKANYYRNHSSNQLGGYPLPSTTGFYRIIRNQNWVIQNSGWELSLSSTNIRSRNFTWSSNLNLTIPKTLLVNYPDLIKSSLASDFTIGQPLSFQKVFHYMGVDPATGVYLFADKNGKPTTTPNDPVDRTVLVDQAPKFYGGFNNTFRYKGFQLDVFFSFVKQIAQNYAFAGSSAPGSFSGGQGNEPLSMLNAWQKPGDIKPIQRYYTGNGVDLTQSWRYVIQSDAAWMDASYLRLKNVSLSWELPDNWVKNAYIQSCSLFVQGQNLFTITRYQGLDPETKSSTTLPPLRVITLGVRASL